VAAVKPLPPVTEAVGGAGGASIGRQGQRFVATSTLREIIRYAYELESFESVDAGPQWLDDRYDIAAVIPQSVTDPAAPRGMLRTLLAERFTLAVRWSTREQPVYALVFARRDGRPGPGLKPSTADCAEPQPARFTEPGTQSQSPEDYARMLKPVCDMVYQPFRARIIANARTMDDLARILSRVPTLRAPVVNRTTVTTRFDFELLYAPDRLAPGSAAAAAPSLEQPPSLFVALEEQLGLKLESSRGAVRSLVVERVERPAPD
jgi:uncharacterized protein (TIGR03435 family)